MKKSTPGPWYFSKHEELGATRFYIAQADGASYTPNYSDVAFSTCPGEYVDIQEANARLMAAAPDLLDALKEVVRISDRKHDAWDAAKAAIAKATRSQP